MQEGEYIWFSGELLPWAEAKVHVLAHALHYGSGAFEGLRAYDLNDRPAILGLERHAERLCQSCKILYMDLPWNAAEICEAIKQTVRANGDKDCYVRPLAFRGYGNLGIMPNKCPTELIVASFPWGPYHGEEGIKRGVDVAVSSWQRMAPNTHPSMAKATGNYINSMMVIMEARRHGYAEGIVLDTEGYVCEGSGENIFLVCDGVLVTPALGLSILPGITREFVMKLAQDQDIPVSEQRIAREMMYTADEMFMTGTAAEITPIRTVDGLPIGDGEPGEITRRIQGDFFSIVQGRAADRHEWLTPV